MVWVIRRSRSATAVLAVGLSMFAMRCGGQSIVKSDGNAGEAPGSGGTGTGGRGVGGSVDTGGVGGTGMGARGGKGGAGGSAGALGVPFGGMSGAGLAGFPQGGMVGDPFAHCVVPPLVYGTACSLEQTCDALGCGEPWALQGTDGCLRATCTSHIDCGVGIRCVPAPVGGAWDEWLTAGCESCEILEGRCACTCLEGSPGLRAVCLDQSDYPPPDDCPIDGLSCNELGFAGLVVERYLAAPDFQTDVLPLLQSCWNKVFDRFNDDCAGGQGGEGGSN